MAALSHPALSSLEAFIHEAFGQAAISPDDAVSEAAITKFWSAHVQENEVATSSHFSLAGFRKTFVLATPADPSNRTGAVAATHVFTALQDGQAVTVTVVAVLRIKWVPEHGHHHNGGRREVVTESYVINTSS
ncbi:hypothetical protein FB451DRAFT_1557036 [Mycena latifolia]|nr:hypothetical protein FB451DRAFT_1557036 [Mycena latifolia]